MRLNKLLLILFTTLSFATISRAEDKAIKGFSGGMMVHSGYQFGGDNPYNLHISSPTFGIGGCAKLHFTDHFRAGFEGYFSNVGLKEKSGFQSGSHNKVFWAGALAEWFRKCDRFTPFAGAGTGGGMETSCYILAGDKHDWIPEGSAIYRKQPFFYVDPYIGTEYKVGGALRLIMKADWLLAINSEGLNRPQGPRIYFGIIFAR